MAKPFAIAMRGYFGLKEGQTIGGFATELKELSDKDRTEFHEMLQKELNEEIVPPTLTGK